MLRGLIYDAFFQPLTSRWYREVLERLPDGATLLDVGIGTGGALADNAHLVRQKRLRITGIDIDPDYIERAHKNVRNAGLADHVEMRLESVYDHNHREYDAVYFSASFMMLPEQKRALQHVSRMLKPGGRVFFTQTFSERRSRLLEKTKPLLKKLTTIEFGRVTYEQDFVHTLQEGGLQLEELTVIDVTIGLSYRIAVATLRPRVL